MRGFADETVLIVPPPWIGSNLVKDLHPVFGERRGRRAFDEGLETLFGGRVVAGVDFVGAEGRSDGLEVGLYALFRWNRATCSAHQEDASDGEDPDRDCRED